MTKKVEVEFQADDKLSKLVKEMDKNFSDLDDSIQQTKQQMADLDQANQKSTLQFTELNSAINVGKQVYGELQKVIDATVGKTVEYANQVRALSIDIGATSEESSRLIQLADDMNVSYEQLTTAMEGAIRKGVDPSISGLGKLSDQYLALAPGVERTKFLMDNFGRSGADIARLMELGSQNIDSMGHSIDGTARLMTGPAMQAAENYRVQLDNLNDSIENIEMTIGLLAIPDLTKDLEGLADGLQSSGTLQALQDFYNLNKWLVELQQGPWAQAMSRRNAAMQADAQKTEEAKQAMQNYTTGLSASKGAIDENITAFWDTNDAIAHVREGMAKIGQDTKVGKLDVSGYLKGLEAINQQYDGLLLSAQNFQKENYGNQILSIAGAAWEAGNITKDQYKTVFGEVSTQLLGMSGDQSKAAQDMLDAMDNWKNGSVADAQAIIDKVREMDDAIYHVPKDVQINFNLTTTGDIPNIGKPTGSFPTTKTTTTTTTTQPKTPHPNIPQYARGGSFDVGAIGGGGRDSQLVQFMATPGERVTVSPPGQQPGNVIYSPINIQVYSTDPQASAGEMMNKLQRAQRVQQARISSGVGYAGT